MEVMLGGWLNVPARLLTNIITVFLFWHKANDNFFPPDLDKELKTNKNLASEQGVVLQCFREKDGWGLGRAVRRRCGLYWFSFFLGNQNKGKMVNIWFVSFPILSIYHQKVFTGWWYNLYHFSFLLLKLFSFSKSNITNMTNPNIWQMWDKI